MKLVGSLCLFTTLLCTPLFAQVITFDNQGWNTNQYVDSNFTISGALYSGNKHFYTNYGYNFDVYNVSLFFVFKNEEDQFTITSDELFNFESVAAYQVSELSTDTLIIEGWNGLNKRYINTFLNITVWQILTLDYENINKLVFRLGKSGYERLTDFNFDNFSFNNLVPVELVSFIAVIKNNNTILLKWKTATEVNNYGFDIERIKDNSDWLTISFVEGHGNSNSPKQYNFIDTDIGLSGNYYYRLKQIDNDGTYEYSDIVSVEVGLPNSFYLSQNYPNPFNPNTVINYSIPKESKVVLKVYDVLGKEISTLVNENKPTGNYSTTFNVGSLSSGIYIYKLIAGGFVSSKKMMVIK